MFVTPGDFHEYLQAVIDRHPKDLSIILNSLGITGEPTVERLVSAYEKYPLRLTQLMAEVGVENFLSFSAADLKTPDFWQKLFTAGSTLDQAAAQVKAAAQGGQSPSPAVQQPPAPAPTGMSATKKIILVGVIIVVVLTVVYLIIKSRKP